MKYIKRLFSNWLAQLVILVLFALYIIFGTGNNPEWMGTVAVFLIAMLLGPIFLKREEIMNVDDLEKLRESKGGTSLEYLHHLQKNRNLQGFGMGLRIEQPLEPF